MLTPCKFLCSIFSFVKYFIKNIGIKLIPKKYELIVFAVFMSGFMSLLMSGVVSYINMGLVSNFTTIWFEAFVKSYSIAFPTVLVVVPVVRKIVSRLVR
jgi:hypothetical protein